MKTKEMKRSEPPAFYVSLPYTQNMHTEKRKCHGNVEKRVLN